MKRTVLTTMVLALSVASFAQASGNDNSGSKGLRDAADRIGVQHDRHSFGDADRGKTTVDSVTRDIGGGFNAGGFRSSTSDSHVGGDKSRGGQTYGGTIGYRW
ncbi:MAG: hypothetical protein IPG11_13065 [Flavobacteriales bacterium]|nr:hypothetical protein [Flavobacteriales bacterium]